MTSSKRSFWKNSVLLACMVLGLSVVVWAAAHLVPARVRDTDEFYANGHRFVFSKRACEIGNENVPDPAKRSMCVKPVADFATGGHDAQEVMMIGIVCGGCELRFYQDPRFVGRRELVDIVKSDFDLGNTRHGLDPRFKCDDHQCKAIISVAGTEWLFTRIDESPTPINKAYDTATRMLEEMSRAS